MRLEAAIFDMDGLLLESESHWRRAEQEASDRLGLGLTTADFEATMGHRMHDVAKLWFDVHPWEGPTTDEVADQVIDRLIELMDTAVPLPGVLQAIEMVEAAGLRLALCSSSSRRLIDAALQAIGLADVFEVVHSAENDEYGKPHPMPYLTTASELGVNPRRCLAFEDSVAGCVSAKGAEMVVVAVPDPAAKGTTLFGFVDVVLESLTQFDVDVLGAVDAGVTQPILSRPRFHLAFGVDDLEAARTFYGGILGCPEGRSADTWVDFDLWGHQIVAHFDPDRYAPATNDVDGHAVPASHFGVLLTAGAWRDLAHRLGQADVPFLMEPTTRFAGLPGEQHTMFVQDPAGNALEFKAFADDRQVFARSA